MAVWRQRADDLSSDVSALKARIQERNERLDFLEVCGLVASDALLVFTLSFFP
jgi:hypothetical protein